MKIKTAIFILLSFLLFSSMINLPTRKSTVFWLEKSFREIEVLGKNDGATVIVPVAQIEAHGPHLPVGTDYFITNEIAKRTAEKCNAIVGPPVLLGNCIDFSCWPGYIIIDNSTFFSIIKNYCQSVAEHGFSKLVFIVQHGGSNVNGVRLAVEEYHKENPGMSILISTTSMLLGKEIAEFRKKNFNIDTAVMLAIRPDLVNMDKLPEKIDVKSIPRNVISYKKCWTLADISPDALFVLPTSSTKEDGNKILDIVVKNLVNLIASD
ncbi:hypothetical protein DRQ09_05770 [candidate division KSB1 bacterium]|nr:MAG: hypothetical protein DRQ09_05770 [candidate division KSB1 bacterium]